LSCHEVVPPDCDGAGPCVYHDAHTDVEQSTVDNDGHFLFLKAYTIGGCGAGTTNQRIELWRWAGGTKTVLGHIDARCVPDLGSQDKIADYFDVYFDHTNGVLLIPLQRLCLGVSGPYTCNYSTNSVVMGISGFSTTFEILQTYTPQPASLAFRVPVMPEGLGGAEHFDTYWGPLTKPIDFTQAHPMQCGYPATPPHVGDYETVTDTLPTPAPDSGYYYLTAATYQGQTRYGRKTSGGKLSGRDPALLPACVMP
jgi:hypothetical protein